MSEAQRAAHMRLMESLKDKIRTHTSERPRVGAKPGAMPAGFIRRKSPAPA